MRRKLIHPAVVAGATAAVTVMVHESLAGVRGHVSILKFIEANWDLKPLTSFSEDNLPNATPQAYVPKVRPAIGNLMTMFDFSHPHFGTIKLPVRPAPRHAAPHPPAVVFTER